MTLFLPLVYSKKI
jgi:hypothetical protein